MPPIALAIALTLASSTAAAAVPRAVEEALSRSLVPPATRVALIDYRPTLATGCVLVRAELARPVAGSGRIPVRLAGRDADGAPCLGWAWTEVRVFGPRLVTTRALREGERLAGAVRQEEREIVPGRPAVTALEAEATAAHPLAAGVEVEPGHLRVGPRPGDAVTVVVRLGSLAVEQPGRSVPCSRGRACAVLPSGRRVAGTFHDGRLQVEAL